MPIIDKVHDSIKAKIDANVSGYAQAIVEQVKVSYDGKAFSHGPELFPGIPATQVRDMIYGAFAIAVAKGVGEATADVFSETRLAHLADVAEHSGDPEKEAFAEAIEAFYLTPGGPGVFMVR